MEDDEELKRYIKRLENKCSHERAYPTGNSCYEGCCDQWYCPDCGLTFIEEVED